MTTMADRPAANNATTFKLAILAMLLSLWMIGRSSEPDAPPPLTDDELLAAIENRGASTGVDPAAKDEKADPDSAHHASQVGHVRGLVKFIGERPEAKPIDLNSDPYCQMFYDGKPTPRSERWVISNGGALANVLVHVTAGLPDRAWSPPAEAKIVRVAGCRYEPHVTAMMLGQWVEFHNHDQTLHNIHINPKINPHFGVDQPPRDHPLLRWQPTRPEIGVFTKCDVHSWMNCQVHILPHPFFSVSDSKGEFEIMNLPPGEYELSAWHEAKNAKSAPTPIKVKVEAGKTTQLVIEVGR